jgi:hypothetical protein
MKMYLGEVVGWGGVDWVGLAQDREPGSAAQTHLMLCLTFIAAATVI